MSRPARVEPKRNVAVSLYLCPSHTVSCHVFIPVHVVQCYESNRSFGRGLAATARFPSRAGVTPALSSDLKARYAKLDAAASHVARARRSNVTMREMRSRHFQSLATLFSVPLAGGPQRPSRQDPTD